MAALHHDFVVFSDDWGRHPSSCQHLFSQLTRRHRVLWVNTIGLRAPRADRFTLLRGLEKLGQWARPLRQITEQFWVYSPVMLPAAGGVAGQLNSRLVAHFLRRAMARCGLERPILFTSVPTAADYLGKLDERAVVYYVTDDYRRWPGADADRVAAQDRLLFEKADLVLPAGEALIEGRQANGRIELLPHAVDLDHFAAAATGPAEPADLAAIQHPRLGFFGLIYEKVDLALFARIARARPRWQLVLIGPVETDVSALAALPNVHILGAKPYADLPRYLHALDALLLAYVLDEQTLRNAPLKIRECLAVGKPIVARAIPDLQQYAHLVHLAGTDEEYLAACDRAVEGQGADAADMRRAVSGQTWEARARQVEETLAGVLKSVAQPPPAVHIEPTGPSALREQQVARPTGMAEGGRATSGRATPSKWDAYIASHPNGCVWHRYGWLNAMRQAYAMRCWDLAVFRGDRIAGILPLALQTSRLFGRHLVSLPWLDHAGILADDDAAEENLIHQATSLALDLKADLTLRQLVPVGWLAGSARTDKAAMVLDLPEDAERLWRTFDAKVRNQVRKAQKSGLTATWCGQEALGEFFQVYSTNMRDLGSPPHSRAFFECAFRELADLARLLVVRHDGRAAAAALVLADPRGWQVPWASSLRSLNSLCPNHLMYWTILQGACGQVSRFCFGRSTVDSGTYKFKQQWGARAVELTWQTWPPRQSTAAGADEGGVLVRAAQKAWRRLPVALARLLGPQLIKSVG